MRRLVLIGVLLLAGGCGPSTPSAGAVGLDGLPPGAMDAAKQRLPGVKFEKAWRTAKGTYDMQGKDAKGKIREVHFDADGKIISVE